MPMIKNATPMVVRLFARVDIDNDSGCWNWRGHKTGDGYGVLNIDRKLVRTHRISYEIHFGPIPEGMQVCHKCDNRACANPDHFFLGTNADNMADKVAKGRQSSAGGAKGITHPLSKLTDEDIIAIRAAKGVSQRRLAAQFGVSQVNICFILSGRAWAHIQVPDARTAQ